MIDDTNLDFANELIKRYGEDRFYHCCQRTSTPTHTVATYLSLNKDCDRETCKNFFRNLGMPNCEQEAEWFYLDRSKVVVRNNIKNIPDIDLRTELCRISFGFSRYWKEYGLRTHQLPDHLHARMILGEKNEWVENYVKWIKTSSE